MKHTSLDTSLANFICKVNYVALVDPKGGAKDALLSVHFLSFSCSFRQKFCQIIDWFTPLWGWLPWEILDPPLSKVAQLTKSCLLLPPKSLILQNS